MVENHNDQSNDRSCVSPGQAKLIGEYLKLLRERGGKDGWFQAKRGHSMSLHDLSVASNVRKDYISRIENGHWKRVGGQIWEKLAKALHTSVEDLLNVGATETTLYDLEVVRIPIRGEEGGFVYIAKRDMPLVDGARLVAVRVDTEGLQGIHVGDLLVLLVDAAFTDDALYEVTYRGEHIIRYLKRQGDSLFMYGMGSPILAPAEDVKIEGRFIYCARGYALKPLSEST